MRRLPTSIAAAVIAAGLLAGPAVAAPEDVGSDLVVAVEGTGPEQDPEGGGQPAFPDEEEPAEGDKPIQFPLDLDTPYGLFGLFLILSALAAGGIGLLNATKNLRGERDQADGSWRPR